MMMKRKENLQETLCDDDHQCIECCVIAVNCSKIRRSVPAKYNDPSLFIAYTAFIYSETTKGE